MLKCASTHNVQEVIEVFINVDGLPISQSGAGKFWPILAMVVNIKLRQVFTVGVYYGKENPKDNNEFLRRFVDEAKELIHSGIEYSGKIVSFRIVAFICDVPARAFILSTKGHSGYSSCFYCIVRGEYAGQMVFLDNHAQLRTDLSFRSKDDEDHHIGHSIIEEFSNFDMISSFPNDPMHLLDLGWTRKLLKLWFGNKGSLITGFSGVEIKRINDHIDRIIPYTPREFARKPRSL